MPAQDVTLSNRRTWLNHKSFAIVTLFTCLIPALTFTSLAPEQAEAQATLFHGLMERVEPAKNGPGLIVCEPVTDSSNKALVNLGAGISEWLTFYVAGAPQFSKTPFWRSLDRVKSELKRPNLQLTPADAPRALSMSGATHIAVGTISGTAEQCTLTIQVLSAGNPNPINGPITITASAADLPGKLSKLGADIASRAGLTLAIPKCQLTRDQLSVLGEMRWPAKHISSSQLKPVETRLQMAALQIAQKDPLGGFIYLDRSGMRDLAKLQPIIATLVKQDPHNGLIYSELGWVEPKLLGRYVVHMAKATSQYPNNYLFSTALTYFWRINHKEENELAQAVESVKCSMKNPDAWLTLGQTLSGMASGVRRQRFSDQLSVDERTSLDALYKRWLGAVEEAVKLDPLFGRGWLRVSAAACSAGCKQEAETAFQKASDLCEERYDLYWWGLQLYQRKWLNDMGKLKEVAQSAGNDKRLTKAEHQKLANEIKDAYPELEVLIKATTASAPPD